MASPILIHLPHASLEVPAEWRGGFALGDAELQMELLAMTDRFTDELFEIKGAERLVFPVSRLVVDPERFRDDRQEPMAAKGMGAYYVRTHRGEPMRTEKGREEALARYYDPHHAALEEWADRARAAYPAALLIDAHSFPDRPHPCDLDPLFPRPDICLGTDPSHTPSELTAWAGAAFQSQGWTVEVDRPYRGTMTPASRYRKDPAMHSLMVELNRRLYMDESTGAKRDSFDAVRAALRAALAEVVDRWRAAMPGQLLA